MKAMFSAMNVSESEPCLLFVNNLSKAFLYIAHFSVLVRRRCGCCANADETTVTIMNTDNQKAFEPTTRISIYDKERRVMAARNTCISHHRYNNRANIECNNWRLTRLISIFA